MPFGISNFERLPWHTKIAFEDAEVQLLAWLTKKPASEGARDGNNGLSGIGATGAAGAGLFGAIATAVAGGATEADGQHWQNGPWWFDTRETTVAALKPPMLSGGTYHNYAPAGIDTAVILEIEPDGGDVTITGIRCADISVKRLLMVRNRDQARTLTLTNQGSGSQDQYRFSLPADLILGPKQCGWFFYDPMDHRWASFVTPQSSGGLAGVGGSDIDLATDVTGILPIVNGGTGSANDGSIIKTVGLDLTEAMIEVLNSAPTTVLAAQGAGTLIIPVSFMLYTNVTAAYSTSPQWALAYAGSPTMAITDGLTPTLNTITSNHTVARILGWTIRTSTFDPRNNAVVIRASADPGTPGTGVATGRLVMKYYIETGVS